MGTLNLQELQLAPGYELDQLLAESIGYKRDQIKLVPVLAVNGGKECQVFHEGSWKRFSHQDPSVAFPLSVKYGFLPFNLRSIVAFGSDKLPPLYQVFTIQGGPLYSRVVSGEPARTFTHEDPHRALALALIFHLKGSHV